MNFSVAQWWGLVALGLVLPSACHPGVVLESRPAVTPPAEATLVSTPPEHSSFPCQSTRCQADQVCCRYGSMGLCQTLAEEVTQGIARGDFGGVYESCPLDDTGTAPFLGAALCGSHLDCGQNQACVQPWEENVGRCLPRGSTGVELCVEGELCSEPHSECFQGTCRARDAQRLCGKSSCPDGTTCMGDPTGNLRSATWVPTCHPPEAAIEVIPHYKAVLPCTQKADCAGDAICHYAVLPRTQCANFSVLPEYTYMACRTDAECKMLRCDPPMAPRCDFDLELPTCRCAQANTERNCQAVADGSTCDIDGVPMGVCLKSSCVALEVCHAHCRASKSQTLSCETEVYPCTEPSCESFHQSQLEHCEHIKKVELALCLHQTCGDTTLPIPEPTQ